jgi:hypothetical protein
MRRTPEPRRRDHDGYRIHTPVSTLGVRGTQFDVSIKGREVRVSVLDGEVVLCPNDGRPNFVDCAEAIAGQTILSTRTRANVVPTASLPKLRADLLPLSAVASATASTLPAAGGALGSATSAGGAAATAATGAATTLGDTATSTIGGFGSAASPRCWRWQHGGKSRWNDRGTRRHCRWPWQYVGRWDWRARPRDGRPGRSRWRIGWD